MEKDRYIAGYEIGDGSILIYPINPGSESPYEVDIFDEAFDLSMKKNSEKPLGWCVYKIEDNSFVPVVALRKS